MCLNKNAFISKFQVCAHVSKYCQFTLRPSPTASQLNITQCRIVTINKLSWRIKSQGENIAETLAESKNVHLSINSAL